MFDIFVRVFFTALVLGFFTLFVYQLLKDIDKLSAFWSKVLNVLFNVEILVIAVSAIGMIWTFTGTFTG